MIFRSHSGLRWLESPLLLGKPGIKHGFLMREGGVSHGPYRSLNLGDRVGDDPDAVAENLARVQAVFELPRLVQVNQVHGKRILAVGKKSPRADQEADGLSTNVPGTGLLVKHADCQPAIIYDPKRHAVAVIHAGWRGNVLNIYGAALNHMMEHYGSRPQDLWVAIGPSLGPQAAEFIRLEEEFPESQWIHRLDATHMDLWALARHQFMQGGVPSEQIHVAEVCNRSNPASYFSYRRDKVTGRHGTVALLL